eukprot:Gb_14387 [translate_table: standard]
MELFVASLFSNNSSLQQIVLQCMLAYCQCQLPDPYHLHLKHEGLLEPNGVILDEGTLGLACLENIQSALPSLIYLRHLANKITSPADCVRCSLGQDDFLVIGPCFEDCSTPQWYYKEIQDVSKLILGQNASLV